MAAIFQNRDLYKKLQSPLKTLFVALLFTLTSCEKDKEPFPITMQVSQTLVNADYSIQVNGENKTQELANYQLTVFHGDNVVITLWPKAGSKGIVRCVITQKKQWEINAYNQVGEKTLTFEIP